MNKHNSIKNISHFNLKVKYALRYAELGLAVLPLHGIVDGKCTCGNSECKSQGKHPMTIHGVKDATTDRETIIRWWTEHPEANIGIATGAKSGIVGIDIDGKDGEESLQELTDKHGELPITPKQRTGKGYHLIYKHPGGQIKNTTGIRKGIDIRGDEGYIVATPSVHWTGKTYLWEIYPGKVPFADMPGWLLEVIREGEKVIKLERTEPIARKIAVGEVIPEGQRNDTLARIAGKLYHQMKTQDEVYQELWDYNIKYCNPPLCEREVKMIAGSIKKCDEKSREKKACLYELNEAGNAMRLLAWYGDDIKYCRTTDKWFKWNKKIWKMAIKPDMTYLALEALNHALYAEAALINDEKERERFRSFINASKTDLKLNAAVRLARGVPFVGVEKKDFNQYTNLASSENGTIDLSTGEIREHRREDLITQIIPYNFYPDADYTEWVNFLLQIMDGNMAMVDFLCRAIGYSITGEKTDQVLFICYGAGQNGKTTFFNVVKKVLGDYAGSIPVDLLMRRGLATNPFELSVLDGKRLVTANEGEEYDKIREGLIKQLTSDDPILTRRLYENYWELEPVYHIWFATNHLPYVLGRDYAIWSRLKLILFKVCFDNTTRDIHLKEKLLKKAEGILRWMVKGALWWYYAGLDYPDEVLMATSKWSQELDTIGAFLAEKTREKKGSIVYTQDLRVSYHQWCNDMGIKPKSWHKVVKYLITHKYQEKRDRQGLYWVDLELV